MEAPACCIKGLPAAPLLESLRLWGAGTAAPLLESLLLWCPRAAVTAAAVAGMDPPLLAEMRPDPKEGATPDPL